MSFRSFGQSVRLILTFLVGIAWTPVLSRSQEIATISDVYRLADHSPRVRAANALAQAARSRISPARLLPDPELQLGFMNRELPSLAPMNPLGMTQIQLMQMIPLGGKLRYAGRAASSEANAQSARADDVRWEVRARAAMQFYDLYEVESKLAIARESRVLIQDIAKTTQSMYAVGNGKQSDVLKAHVEAARMSEDIVRMESMRATEAARLAATLDAPAATIKVPRSITVADSIPALESLMSEAEQSRPMVVAEKGMLATATAQQLKARSEIWPDVQVGVQYGWRAGEMGTERMGSLMIGAAIPVYARSRQLKMREEALAMREMAAAGLAEARADTRGRIAEAYANFTRARNLKTRYRATILPQAEATVTASLAAYRAGEVNLMTLLDNQMTVNRYRQELVTLEAEQGKAIAEIEMLIGRSLPDPEVKRALQ